MNKEIRITELSVSVYDSISVSEEMVIELIIKRITICDTPKNNEMVVSVKEYRQLLGDYVSTNKRIVERLQFLEAFCRNVIKPELQIYVKQQK